MADLTEVLGYLCNSCGHVFSDAIWKLHLLDRGGWEGKTVRCTQCNSADLSKSTGYVKADGSPHIAESPAPVQES